MRCIERHQSLSAYLDGELQEPDAGQLVSHLAECPTCRGYLHDLSQIRQLVRAGQGCELTEGLLERIQAAALNARGRRTVRVRGWTVRAASVAAGFAVYLAAYGGFSAWVRTDIEWRAIEPNHVREVLAETAVALGGAPAAEEPWAWLAQRPESRLLQVLFEDR